MNEVRVVGHGSEVSPIMIVQDYPSADDCKSGKTLSAGSGKMVDQFLRQNGHSLAKCYMTTYIKAPLRGYNTKNKKQAREILHHVRQEADWNQILLDEIREIKPNVIISLGELALNFLTGEKSIYSFRGSILPLKPELVWDITKHIRVIPVLHPRDIVQNITTQVYTTIDYAKAVRNINNKLPIEEIGHVWIIRSSEALYNWWTRSKKYEYLAIDFESHHNFPTCVGFCANGNEAVSAPLLSRDISNHEQMYMWRVVDEILRSKMPKVNQNMNYDWTLSDRLGFQMNNIIGDTQLMANIIYPELPKALHFLTSIYTDIPYYKDEGRNYDPKLQSFDVMMKYNAKDALAAHQVWTAQQQDAKEQKVYSFYHGFIHKLFYHYRKINDRGIRIDELKRFELLEKYSKMLYDNLTSINTVYGQVLNVRSPDQVGRFVYDFLQCPLHTHFTDSGKEKYSTDEDTLTNMYLNEIKDETVKRLLRQVILCRKIFSVLNLLEAPIHPDKRMRTTYNISGTTNGRTSTSTATGWYFELDFEKHCIKDGCEFGTAFQKIPKHGFEFEGERFGKDIREMFVPSPGYSFFGLDGANAEGRVVCVLAQDWDSLSYIESGNNIHKLTASWIYLCKPEEIKKDTDKYNIGKRARHAGHLGQTGAGLSPQIYRSIPFCNKVMETFHKNAPKVREVFQYEVERIVISGKRRLETPQGRIRDFFGLTKTNIHEIAKQAYSYIPQATVSDHFKEISLKIALMADWAYQLGEFHDGLFWEIPSQRLEQFHEISLIESDKKINFKNCSLSRDFELMIPIEQEYSHENWLNMKEIQIENCTSVGW